MTQMRYWLIPHLKANCWYIDCGKSVCLVEEEGVKIACDKVDSKDAELRTDHVEEPERDNEVDLSLLAKKEKNNILN
jgi:hypothetical protein